MSFDMHFKRSLAAMFMTKFLLALMIILTGVKFTADNAALIQKCSIMKPGGQDEKSQDEKEEHKNCKHDNEDQFYACYPARHNLSNVQLKNSSPLTPFGPYCSFAGRPNTPPPDLL